MLEFILLPLGIHIFLILLKSPASDLSIQKAHQFRSTNYIFLSRKKRHKLRDSFPLEVPIGKIFVHQVNTGNAVTGRT